MDFFNPKKKLGQHFLKDIKIAEKIVNSLDRDKKEIYSSRYYGNSFQKKDRSEIA